MDLNSSPLLNRLKSLKTFDFKDIIIVVTKAIFNKLDKPEVNIT